MLSLHVAKQHRFIHHAQAARVLEDARHCAIAEIKAGDLALGGNLQRGLSMFWPARACMHRFIHQALNPCPLRVESSLALERLAEALLGLCGALLQLL